MSDDPRVQVWAVERIDGTAQSHHDLAFPERAVAHVWDLRIAAKALVLGSRQKLSESGLARAQLDGVEIATRRSGGGAVLIDPNTAAWIDVLVPMTHPWCGDDLTVAFLAVGERWAQVLRELGHDAEVYRGRPDRHDGLAAQACFAGLGWGEVTIDGSKVVGLSQRRTRWGARVQCLADLSGGAAHVGDYLNLDSAERDQLRTRCGRAIDASARVSDTLAAAFLGLFSP